MSKSKFSLHRKTTSTKMYVLQNVSYMYSGYILAHNGLGFVIGSASVPSVLMCMVRVV